MSDCNRTKRTEVVDAKDLAVWFYGLITVLALMALYAAHTSYFSNEYESAKADYYQSRCDQSATSGFIPLESDVIAATRENEAAKAAGKGEQEPDYPNYCDLAAQYRSATAAEASRDAAWFVGFLTIIGVLLLWRTLVQTRKAVAGTEDATRAAQAAVDETRRIGEAQARCYCQITDVVLHIDMGEVTFDLAISNTGQSPAISVGVAFECDAFNRDEPEFKFSALDQVSANNSKTPFRDIGAADVQRITKAACPVRNKGGHGQFSTFKFMVRLTYLDVFDAPVEKNYICFAIVHCPDFKIIKTTIPTQIFDVDSYRRL